MHKKSHHFLMSTRKILYGTLRACEQRGLDFLACWGGKKCNNGLGDKWRRNVLGRGKIFRSLRERSTWCLCS
jgi:hypothetical protein